MKGEVKLRREQPGCLPFTLSYSVFSLPQSLSFAPRMQNDTPPAPSRHYRHSPPGHSPGCRWRLCAPEVWQRSRIPIGSSCHTPGSRSRRCGRPSGRPSLAGRLSSCRGWCPWARRRGYAPSSRHGPAPGCWRCSPRCQARSAKLRVSDVRASQYLFIKHSIPSGKRSPSRQAPRS